MLMKMLAYKSWANELTYDAVEALPPGEDQKPRKTRWESIAYTLSHVLVVDDIFRCHLEGRPHDYRIRNMDERLPTAALRERQREMDEWYLNFASGLDDGALAAVVNFSFVGGGQGSMTRTEILIHLVNHGTYHRGLVSDMMAQVPAEMPVNDFPVFLRDVWNPRQAEMTQPR